jgi:hypothetical protein
MSWLIQQLGITAQTRVLDVGGTSYNWDLSPVRPRLTLLNLERTRSEAGEGITLVVGDGRALPFPDGAFDIVFSNSVIEHIGSDKGREEFAAEIRRVGRHYWVQTPNRWFPVEPHLVTPLVHFLPRRWQERLVRRATVWEWLARPRPDQREYYIEHYLRDIRLLDAEGLRRLFPDARVKRERAFGLTKSLIALK